MAAPTSAEARALVVSHEVVTKVEWKRWYDPDTDYQPLQELPGLVVTGGAAQMDRWSFVRRTGNLTVGGREAIVRQDWTGPLSPHNRYRLWRGVKIGGWEKLWLLGTFMLTGFKPGPFGELSLELADEMKMVELDDLPAPLGLPADVPVADALRWLLTDTTTWGDYAGTHNGYTDEGPLAPQTWAAMTPVPTFTDPRNGDPTKDPPAWVTTGPLNTTGTMADLLGEVAELSGSRSSAVDTLMAVTDTAVYVDEYGVLRVAKRPATIDAGTWDPAAIIAGGHLTWTFDVGDGGSVIEQTPEWTIEDTINETVITSADYARRAQVTTGPMSPNQLGMTLRYMEDVSSEPFSEQRPQLLAYANRVAAEQLGAARPISVSSLVLPFLKPDDYVLVPSFVGTVRGDDEMVIVDSVSIPLDHAAEMTMTTRKLDLDNAPDGVL